jgi:hypothetical protein
MKTRLLKNATTDVAWFLISVESRNVDWAAADFQMGRRLDIYAAPTAGV